MAIVVRLRTGKDEYILAEADNTVVLPMSLVLPTAGDKPGIPPGMEPVSNVKRLEQEFAEVRRIVVSCCKSLYEAFTEIPRPKKVTAEFGVKLGGETGVPMIAKASGEANFKISVEWENPAAAEQR